MTDLERFNEIYDEFCEWVAGVEEDDPLPSEIRFVYFVFSGGQGMNVLQYVGCEIKQKIICSFDYCPLESQFFYSRPFLRLEKEQAKQFGELFVREIKNNQKFQDQFCGKEIEFVELGDVLK